MSLKPRLDSSVPSRIMGGSFKLVRSEKVSETPSRVLLDVYYRKCR